MKQLNFQDLPAWVHLSLLNLIQQKVNSFVATGNLFIRDWAPQFSDSSRLLPTEWISNASLRISTEWQHVQSSVRYDSLTDFCLECSSLHFISAIHFLTETGLESSTKLEFKQRVSIALGAAKGKSKV